jgi:2-polyprenyl-6-methoxyphenol hydroxylase-like FAD-dependent oxidoreductase
MEVLLDEHEDTVDKTFGDELFRPEIDRGPLRDMLIASLKEENIVWDAKFVDMTPSGAGWNIQFENGTSAYADLVIAADGANSKLRKYITDIPPVYSGATDIEGTIPNAPVNAPKLWELVKGGSLFALDKGKSIKFISKGDGTLTFLIGLKVPETWISDSGIDFNDRASVSEWFRQEFASWNPDWNELFASDAVTLVPRPWYHFPPDQHWETLPNLTMIGDAAHRIPAYGGEGANQALADAVDLYEALCCNSFGTLSEDHETLLQAPDILPQALAAYEAIMLERSAGITEMALDMTTHFHAEDNLQFVLDLLGGVIS